MEKSKYNNRPTVVDGIRFASAAEARRYNQLKMLERNGEITNLEFQPVYEIKINGHKICKYLADFRYRIGTQGETVIEDVKGVETSVFKLKKKLVEAVHGIKITVVKC